MVARQFSARIGHIIKVIADICPRIAAMPILTAERPVSVRRGPAGSGISRGGAVADHDLVAVVARGPAGAAVAEAKD